MKRIVLFLLCLTAFIASCSAQIIGWDNFETKETIHINSVKLPKMARKYFDGMVFVKGGEFIRNTPEIANFLPQDSTLCSLTDVCKVKTMDIFVSDHEVTNKEYREFVDWVKFRKAYESLAQIYPKKFLNPDGSINENIAIDWSDPLLLEQMCLPPGMMFFRKHEIDTRKLFYHGIPIYPDTLCWGNSSSMMLEGMTRSYFWHPSYDDCPVVGVTFHQAEAYCKWRSERLNESILIANGMLEKPSYFFDIEKYMEFVDTKEREVLRILLFPDFRLPTVKEWEYAAVSIPENPQDKYLKAEMEINKLEKQRIQKEVSSKGRVSNALNKKVTRLRNEVLEHKKAEYIFMPNFEHFVNTSLSDQYMNNLFINGYNANFGAIVTQSGLTIKSYSDDGALGTMSVRHYLPNANNLYDMAGNVAEWAQDRSVGICLNDYAIFYSMGYGANKFKFADLCAFFDPTYLPKLQPYRDFLVLGGVKYKGNYPATKSDTCFYLRNANAKDNISDSLEMMHHEEKLKELYEQSKKRFEHDIKVHQKMMPARIVKGGSWEDPPIYLNPFAKTIKNQNRSSCRIGFRVFMDGPFPPYNTAFKLRN